MPPWDLVYALILREFRVLPSELDKENADEILRYWQILGIFDEYLAKRQKAEAKTKK